VAKWIRYEHQGKAQFGTITNNVITPYSGDMFNNPQKEKGTVNLDAVKLLTPSEPTKMVALWNNYHELAKKNNFHTPATPLYLLKANSSFFPGDATIEHPTGYDGDVFYEGELGIMIGRTAKNVPKSHAEEYIFGYTCINDVTGFAVLKEDSAFDQWVRAKSYDTFGVFGPVVATGLDYNDLKIVTRLNGEVVQQYPANDMMISPPKIVSKLSENMSLHPGDIICTGTSVGLGAMPRNSTIEVEINKIGVLKNTYK